MVVPIETVNTYTYMGVFFQSTGTFNMANLKKEANLPKALC